MNYLIKNLKFKIKNLLLLLSALLVAGAGIFIYSYFFSKPASAAWYDESWLYRKAITVTVASSASDITDLETLVTVDTSTAGKFQSSCQDLRFTNQKGELLPYYIDSGCGTDSTKVWVLADLVPKNTTTYMMYMYYGNPSAPSASDSNKFRLFNGLVGYWAMNESAWAGVAGEAKDSSINGNNGVRAGDATTTASGKYSYGGTFDGTGDYVDIGDITLIDGATQLTVSTWFKSSSATNQVIFAKGYTNNTFNVKIDSSNSYKLYWGVDNATTGASALSNSAVNDGSWHHMVGTWNGSVLDLYLDGVKQTSQGVLSGGSIQNTTDKLAIGAFLASNDSAASLLTGQADDARIYNRALSESEISQLYTNPGNIASNANATTKPSTAAGSEEQSPGPVGYWAFDDGQGQTAQDSSSSNNDGTITGATWQPEDRCVAGKCLYFDGSDDKVDIGDKLDVGTGSFSAGAWVKTTDQDGYIIAKGNANDYSYQLVILSNSPQILMHDAPGNTAYCNAASATSISDNKWHFVVGTWTATTECKLYVDGKLAATDNTLSGTFNNNSAANLLIGGRADGDRPLNGFIDEPKIYPYARTEAQIKADYNAGKTNAGTNSGAGAVLGAQPQDYLSNGLVGYWKMEETATPSLDSSGNGNSGTWNGNTAASAGKFGNGASFDGNGDGITVTSSSSVDLTSNTLTLSAWVNWNGGTTSALYIMDKNSNKYNLALNGGAVGDEGTGRPRFYASGFSANLDADAAISANTWHLITAVADGTTASIYVDGVLVKSAARSVNITSGGNLILGCYATCNATYSFNGKIDETRVYNRALSPKEVSDLYNWAPGPVGYWDFEEGGNIGVGSTAFDRSGNNNAGIWKGTGAKHWDTGKYGKGGKFDGTSDYVNVDSSSNWAFGANDFSINFWIKPDTSQDGPIMGRRWTNRSWMLYLQSGVLYLTASSDGTNWTAPLNASSGVGITLTNNIWQHVAFLRNGSNWYGYLNGAQQDTASSSMTIYSGSEPLHIGADSEGASWYYSKGMLDDIRIYNYARSVKQVISDMNAGHPNVGSPVGSAVGHWDFDEGQGTVANNLGSGGSTYNGTITNATWSQAGKFNRALNFTASNSEYVSVTSPVNTTANTVSAWFKVTTNAANQGVLSAGNSIADGNPYLLLQNNNGTLRIYNNDFSYATVSSISTATWYFVTIVNAGTNQKVYLNGIQKLNRTIGGGNNTNFYIGAGYNATFDGVIDEVKVYNYALTADEVKLDYNRGSSMVLGTLGNLSTLSDSAAGQEYCIPGDSSTCTAPVGRWDFEEGRDNTCTSGVNDVCDTSGSGYDGAWNGTGVKHWDRGKVGSAGKFNGTDDYISAVDAASLDFVGSNATIELWFKADTMPTFQQLISKWDGDPCSGWYIGLRSGQVEADECGGAGALVRSTATLSANTWYHLAVVFDNTNNKVLFYVNGVLDSSNNTDIAFADTGNLLGIGAAYEGTPWSSFFDGIIDQVRIYNYARSAAQIAYDYNKGAPVGYWDFDECQGATAYDQSGNNNHGTITIGATDEATLGTCTTSSTAWGSGATGKRNASLSFDGDDDYVEITNGSNFNFGNNNFTLAAWVYYTTTPGSTNREYIIAHTGADDGGYALATDDLAGGIRFWGNDGSWKNAQATGLVANTWYHFVAVHDGSLNIYVNGVLKQTTAVGTLTNPLTSDFLIGKATNMNYATKYHNGQIDDVKIFNYALTTTQIKNLYNDGAVRFGPSTGSP